MKHHIHCMTTDVLFTARLITFPSLAPAPSPYNNNNNNNNDNNNDNNCNNTNFLRSPISCPCHFLPCQAAPDAVYYMILHQVYANVVCSNMTYYMLSAII